MLLRSSSTPILNSWLHHFKYYSSPEGEFQILQRTKSISFHSKPSIDDPTKKVSTHSQFLQQEANLPKPKKGSPIRHPHSSRKQCKKESNEEEKEAEPSSRIQTLFSSSGLGEKVVNANGDDGLQTLVVDGGGGSGGRTSGGGDGNDGSGMYGNDDNTDAYYQKMISADPGNALLLVNYAKFLKEVRRDMDRAEELCGRAILANPNDGNVLSMYGDLVWQKERDAQRAESYYDQAVKTSPENCYILASYARFLWDAEEDDEDEDGQQETRSSHGCFDDSAHHPPLAAAS
ncbi:uncharacterized protein LOC110613552 [Manihot esculenta]|uniref:Uncharacterized protein n=1 Tax=Manihot esculenta TaxID=3983 RepID=A0A2C9W2Z6_MANES|nr:uncharacterized protein LOC110613552 [Manihot esculenta]OAY52813.1 hypothetical protein MANES_04G113400v8 [Manihot esculenta]